MTAVRVNFQRLVDARGQSLRQMSYQELTSLDQGSEIVHVNGRRGVVSLIIERLEDDWVQVIVQGLLDGRFFNRLKSVALDGFRKHVSGALSELEPHEFYDYD